MPSVTDVHQQSTTTHGKSTPPPPSSSTTTSTSTDPNNVDGMTQAILALEKKQRNLGKRKEKLEGLQQELKEGKELNKDQKEALAKYPEVIGQIECVKELIEQFKKIQADVIKNQKRLSKQAAEEKRLQISQRVCEYAQLRYLLDHRPTSLKPEESKLLDDLSRLIIPTDNASTTISRSVDTVLSIYQGGPAVSTIKNLTGKHPQEFRDMLEQLMKNAQTEFSTSSSTTTDIPQQEEQKQDTFQTTTTTTTTATTNNDEDLTNRNYNEYPLQFDTRNQRVPLEQIIGDNTFFSNDNQLSQDEHHHHHHHHLEQSNDTQQYLSTPTNINTNLHEQSTEETNLTSIDQQTNDEQWQQTRPNTNNQRNNQFNHANRNQHHRPPHNYYQSHQQWRGSRGGRHNGSYSAGTGAGQTRVYNENSPRGRPGGNPNYRGNRGGNYRGGHRGNGHAYQKPSQYQQQQVRSAPPPSSSSDQQ